MASPGNKVGEAYVEVVATDATAAGLASTKVHVEKAVREIKSEVVLTISDQTAEGIKRSQQNFEGWRIQQEKIHSGRGGTGSVAGPGFRGDFSTGAAGFASRIAQDTSKISAYPKVVVQEFAQEAQKANEQVAQSFEQSAKSAVQSWAGASKALVGKILGLGGLVIGTAATFYELGKSIREAFTQSTEATDKFSDSLNRMNAAERIAALKKEAQETATELEAMQEKMFMHTGKFKDAELHLKAVNQELGSLQSREALTGNLDKEKEYTTGALKLANESAQTINDIRLNAARSRMTEEERINDTADSRIRAVMKASLAVETKETIDAINEINKIREQDLADYDAKQREIADEKEQREIDAAERIAEVSRRLSDEQAAASQRSFDAMSAGLASIAAQQRAMSESQIDRMAVSLDNLSMLTQAAARAQPRRLN